MTGIVPIGGTGDGPEDTEPAIETPHEMRPDLSAIGLVEHERGVVEDTYENRAALRQNKMNWDPVYTQTGAPTGLIAARTLEQTKGRRLLSLAEKRPLMTDPESVNSDYLTGLDLIVDERACALTPPWVIGATRHYLREQEEGGPPPGSRRVPKALPHRCRITKTDGIRCMLWSSGRIKDDGLCRIHLRVQRKPGEDVERARRKLMQAAPYAVDVLEDLMENAVSEPVKLKASTEILDRAGLRGGMELDVGLEVTDSRSPAMIVAERLQRLAEGAIMVAGGLGARVQIGTDPEPEPEDAEVVDGEIDASELDG
jgi:hypothetical protein